MDKQIYNHTALLNSPKISTTSFPYLAISLSKLQQFFLVDDPMPDCLSFILSLGGAFTFYSSALNSNKSA